MERSRRRFTPEALSLVVKRSNTGRGLFTMERIPRGTCIIEYTGRTLPKNEWEKSGRYFFWTSSQSMIDGNVPGNRARFINHSCAPNCEVDIKDRRIYIFAKRAIRAGEELTYDYDTEYFDEHIKPHGCGCVKCEKKRVTKRE